MENPKQTFANPTLYINTLILQQVVSGKRCAEQKKQIPTQNYTCYMLSIHDFQQLYQK